MLKNLVITNISNESKEIVVDLDKTVKEILEVADQAFAAGRAVAPVSLVTEASHEAKVTLYVTGKPSKIVNLDQTLTSLIDANDEDIELAIIKNMKSA